MRLVLSGLGLLGILAALLIMATLSNKQLALVPGAMPASSAASMPTAGTAPDPQQLKKLIETTLQQPRPTAE